MAKIVYEIDIKDNGLVSTLEDSSKSVKKVSGELKTFGGSLTSSFDIFKGAFAANLVSGAFGLIKSGISSLIGTMGDFVQEAIGQEQAVSRLNASLRNSGSFTEEASKSFQDFASAIQATTIIGDDAILNQIALAKSFGATNDQATKITQTAIQLSSAFGIDLESATQMVAQSLSGVTKGISKMAPEIKNLTAEQLKAGVAIDILAAKFSGFAEAEVLTFGGALAKAKNSFGEIAEEMGALITQNPVLIKLIGNLSDAFLNVAGKISDNRGSAIDLINVLLKGFTGVIKPIAYTTVAITTLGNGFRIIFKFIQGVLESLAFSFVGFATIVVAVADKMSRAFGGAGFGAVLTGLKKTTIDFGTSMRESLESAFLDSSVSDFNESLLTTADTLEKNISSAFDTAGSKVTNFKNNVDNAKSSLTDLSDVEVGLKVKKEKIAKENIVKAKELPAPTSNGLGGTISAEDLKGRQDKFGDTASVGATAFSSEGGKVIENVGASLLEKIPVFGQVLGPVFRTLVGGPETTKAFITGFVRSIPTIITNLIEALPVIFETLSEEMPAMLLNVAQNLIPMLAKMIPRLIQSIIDHLPTMVQAIVESIPVLLQSLVSSVGPLLEGLIKNAMSLFVVKLTQASAQFIAGIIKGAGRFMQELGDKIKGLFPKVKIGGGGGKGLGVNLGGLKFAEGGQAFTKFVPNGFSNDTFPAKLTSGELVVDRSTSQKLKVFLDNVDSFLGVNRVMIGIQDEAEKFLTVKQNEASSLGLSRAF